ncbi:hypothetical protein PIB30_063494 [Stylosanthes scabra]|uniref:Uncharacterized protein n=1 Tax=Stylosanthes scabra TaxID=79078 RepID=A0ABU6QM92_9FABA|nr:hypothetical protein [Stylosanthes scabra]
MEESDKEEEDEEKTFFIATVFGGNKVVKNEISAKCTDPGPSLVTYKIRGVEVREYTSIVTVAGIAENVLVKIGALTIPVDFHVIKATKGDKGGTPQVWLGRPFLKTENFQLDYIDETLKVGSIKEIFHSAHPTASRKKKAQQMQMYNDKDRGDQALVQAEDKRGEDSKGKIGKGKGLKNTPPSSEEKRKGRNR